MPDNGSSIRELLNQTQSAVEADLFYVALISALAIPDISAALESKDGRTSGKRYAAWFDKWVRPQLRRTRGRENPLSGEDCYAWRCAMLHQGRSQRQNDKFRHIMFSPSEALSSIHYCTISGETLLIRLNDFVSEIVAGCEDWLMSVEATPEFNANYQKFARYHPNGLQPYLNGPLTIG